MLALEKHWNKCIPVAGDHGVAGNCVRLQTF